MACPWTITVSPGRTGCDCQNTCGVSALAKVQTALRKKSTIDHIGFFSKEKRLDLFMVLLMRQVCFNSYDVFIVSPPIHFQTIGGRDLTLVFYSTQPSSHS